MLFFLTGVYLVFSIYFFIQKDFAAGFACIILSEIYGAKYKIKEIIEAEETDDKS